MKIYRSVVGYWMKLMCDHIKVDNILDSHVLLSGLSMNPLEHSHMELPGLFVHVCSHPPL